MLFALMPFGKVKAQILWPNFTFSQSASNLCTGSVEFQVTSPNPANDYIVVENNYETAMGFYLMDMTGKIALYDTSKNADIILVNTENLATGLYLVKVYDGITGELLSTQKLVKTTD